MKVLGLTGSVGMGKTTASAMLSRMGVPVQDADAVVHRALAPGGAAVARVAALFPGVLRGGGIDRKALGAQVFGDEAALRRLEKILHPMVVAAERRFLARARAERRPLVVLDVPLLFESKTNRRCNAVIAMWAPPFLQRDRVLARPGMDKKRLAFIRSQQMSDAEKRRRADYWIPSGLGRAVTWRQLTRVKRELADR